MEQQQRRYLAVIIGKSEKQGEHVDPQVGTLAKTLGIYLATNKYIKMIATGACSGYPEIIAKSVRKANPNMEILAFPPVAENIERFELEKLTPLDEKRFTVVVVPKPAKDELQALIKRSKNLISFAKDNDGIVVVVGGGKGTKKEFKAAVEAGLPIIVLEDSGGFVGEIRDSLSSEEINLSKVRFIKQPAEIEKAIRDLFFQYHEYQDG